MIEFLNEAIEEAYASGKQGAVLLSTIELRHATFTVRVVRNEDDIMATLEPDAPVNGGESVLFQACAFTLSLPGQEEGNPGDLQIAIENVSHLLAPILDSAVDFPSPVDIVYREYLSSDLTAPQTRLLGLKLYKVTMSATQVTGTARYADLVNRAFPHARYDLTRFPSLANVGV